jgi:carboxylate-amine ligase
VIKALMEERWIGYQAQRSWATAPLKRILMDTIARGEGAVIDNPDFIKAFNIQAATPMTAGELWRRIAGDPSIREEIGPEQGAALETILRHGTLATRLIKAAGPNPGRAELTRVYGALCGALADGAPFIPAP